MSEETLVDGWYRDPFGAHDARWFSAGAPTALVRDEGRESHDPPPADAASATVEPVELAEPVVGNGEDLRRVGDEDEETPGEMAWELAAERPQVVRAPRRP